MDFSNFFFMWTSQLAISRIIFPGCSFALELK